MISQPVSPGTGAFTGSAVFLDYASLDFGDLDPAALYRVFPDLILHAHTTPAQIEERLARAEVAIVSDLHLPAGILSRLPRLKLILLASTGTNAVDLAAVRRLGITVCHCQGYGTHAVAQHTLALMLALTNHVARYSALVSTGQWSAADRFCLTDYPICGLNDKRLAIVGQGELGRQVAHLAEAFGMQVSFAGLPGREGPQDKIALDDLLPLADVVSLHCPLTPETAGLINTQRLGLMKRSALLINTARGGLLDETALAGALREGRLAGAALDVLSQEPPPQSHPLLTGDIPNLLITPHVAWSTTGARQCALQQLAENGEAWKAGQPIRVVS